MTRTEAETAARTFREKHGNKAVHSPDDFTAALADLLEKTVAPYIEALAIEAAKSDALSETATEFIEDGRRIARAAALEEAAKAERKAAFWREKYLEFRSHTLPTKYGPVLTTNEERTAGEAEFEKLERNRALAATTKGEGT